MVSQIIRINLVPVHKSYFIQNIVKRFEASNVTTIFNSTLVWNQ